MGNLKIQFGRVCDTVLLAVINYPALNLVGPRRALNMAFVLRDHSGEPQTPPIS